MLKKEELSRNLCIFAALAESIVEENKEIIAARWNEYFKNQK